MGPPQWDGKGQSHLGGMGVLLCHGDTQRGQGHPGEMGTPEEYGAGWGQLQEDGGIQMGRGVLWGMETPRWERRWGNLSCGTLREVEETWVTWGDLGQDEGVHGMGGPEWDRGTQTGWGDPEQDGATQMVWGDPGWDGETLNGMCGP